MPHATTPRLRPGLRPGLRAATAAALSLGLALGLTSAVLAAPAAADEPAPPPAVATSIVLSAPVKVVDEKAVVLSTRWTTATGTPVVGGLVTYDQLVAGAWKGVTTRRSDASGTATLSVVPRTDTVWRARGAAGTGTAGPWLASVSGRASIDNVPPRAPLALPGPAPRRLPAQARAAGSGANAVVSRVPDAVWRSMVGRSWHRGCPVGRSGLRLLRVNYWGFDGYRHRGELVMSAGVIGRASAALKDMYAQKLPLRAMYRVDRFGWSPKLQGADDYASMGSDNTSGFNCRSVVNRPGVRSPHASGRAIDLNPWENPYRSASGWVPNSWWVSRSHPQVAWRSASHPVVKIWRKHGFRWTYGNNDSQHWDGRRAPSLMGSFVG